MMATNALPYDDEAHLRKRSLAARSSLSLSPDGQWAAVVVLGLTSGEAATSQRQEAEPLVAVSEEIAGSEVVLVNTRTGQVDRPFEAFHTSCWPAWSPDGKWLALLTQSAERHFPRVTLWSLGEKGPHVFETAPVSPMVHFQALRWTSDSSHVVFMTVSAPAQEKPLVTCVSTSEEGEVADCRESVGVLDIHSGALSTFGAMTRTWGWRLSPDDGRVAFLRYAKPADKPRNTQVNWRQLVVMSLADGAEQLIGEPQPDGWGCSFNWSPDGGAIAWVALAHHSPTQLFVAELGTAPDLLEIALPDDTNFGFFPLGWFPPPAPIWSQGSRDFYVPGHGKLWRFTRGGTIAKTIELPEGGGFDWFANSITALDFPRDSPVAEDGEVWLARHHEVWKVNLTTEAVEPVWDYKKDDPDRPALSNLWIERAADATRQTLYTIQSAADGTIKLHGTDLASGETRVISTLFAGVGELDTGLIRSLSWTLPDGTDCAGSLLLPVRWTEGDRPPVVMSVYGDVRGRGHLSTGKFHGELGVVDAHLLSANGYAVMVPDMPQTDEEPFASLVTAGEAAVHALRESGLVDADRIAVTGSSYGGYTTLCLLTGSKLFRAGIAANGVYDLLRSATDGAAGWTETGQGRMRTSVWENPARYLANSPLYALDKLEAPLLILQGGADEWSTKEGKALFSSLRRLGKQGEMLTYRDVGHAPTSWSIDAQRDWHRRLLIFLEEHL